jgi:hypothetical protein
MSKNIVFTARNFTVTKNISITNMILSIPQQIYNTILFTPNTTITVTSGSATQGYLENTSGIEILKQAIVRFNACNNIWNGYSGQYNKFSVIRCDKKCEEMNCPEFNTYADYIRHKQFINIPQNRTLALE